MKTEKLVRVIGLVLDIVGGVLIGAAVLLETKKDVTNDTLEELEQDIETTVRKETRMTAAGIVVLVLGFLLLIACEFV